MIASLTRRAGPLALGSLLALHDLSAQPSSRAASRVLAFVDVNVVSMTDTGARLHQTVLVRDDRIVAFGPLRSVRVPPDARRVAGGGTRWLIPGLVDMHAHVTTTEQLPLYVAHGVTTYLNLGDHGSHDMIALGRDAQALGPLAPNLLAALRLEGPGGNGLIVRTGDEARRAIAWGATQGYRFVKVYNNLTPEVFAVILAEAQRRHMGVVGHGVRAVGLLAGLRQGQAMVAHAEEYLYTEFRTNPTEARIDQVIADTRASGAWVLPNLVAYGAIARQWGRPKVVDSMLATPEAAWLSPVARINWQRNDYVTRTGSLDAKREFLVAFTGRLHRAGVPLLVGTDAPDIPGVVPGPSVHDELALLVHAGLTPLEALRAATINAGVFTGRFVEGPSFGVIAAGARADFVLLDASPLDDIGNARRVRGVAVRGQYLPREALDASLDSLRRLFAEETRRAAGLRARLAGGGAIGDTAALPRLEETLNNVAYEQLDAKRVTAANQLFALIVARFPLSSNAHESLCEGYVAAADTARAIASCRAALTVDPWNPDAQGVLAGLVPVARH
ncbi:MAG: amidohydrolase family protein [Gemmatimonadetes bacterium]|nr:amidohydrolase family protein [Gemmatimonadota bacterium]